MSSFSMLSCFYYQREYCNNFYIIHSGESRIIFLPERSSIFQCPPKLSAISIKKQSRARFFWPTLYCAF